MVLCAGAALAADAPPCASCHEKQGSAQPKTSMSHALKLPAENLDLHSNPRMEFRQGDYQWTVERSGDGFTYSVTDGAIANMGSGVRGAAL